MTDKEFNEGKRATEAIGRYAEMLDELDRNLSKKRYKDRSIWLALPKDVTDVWYLQEIGRVTLVNIGPLKPAVAYLKELVRQKIDELEAFMESL